MTILYAYEQTMQWNGEDVKHVTLTQTTPDKCTLSEPVICLGKLELQPITLSTVQPNENKS